MDKEGRLYTFVENDRSIKLIKGEGVHGKMIRVKGDLMPQAQYIDVKNYVVEIENGDWMEVTWCDVCSEMVNIVGHVHVKKAGKAHEEKHEHDKDR